MPPASRPPGGRRRDVFIQFLHGQHYVSESATGPWRLREPGTESRNPRKPTRKNKEKPIMGKSGFERRLDEEARQRRRLREAEDAPFDLDQGEFDQVLAETRRFGLEGKGEAGKRVTRREV